MDTPPEINERLFAGMMGKTAEERFLMGLDMMATARELCWSGVEKEGGTLEERQRAFLLRFHGLRR